MLRQLRDSPIIQQGPHLHPDCSAPNNKGICKDWDLFLHCTNLETAWSHARPRDAFVKKRALGLSVFLPTAT